MANHKQQAQTLRERAEERRRLADSLTPPSRQAYLSLAEAYETLAAQEEVMQIGTKNGTSEDT